jgi:hypothetical protein
VRDRVQMRCADQSGRQGFPRRRQRPEGVAGPDPAAGVGTGQPQPLAHPGRQRRRPGILGPAGGLERRRPLRRHTHHRVQAALQFRDQVAELGDPDPGRVGGGELVDACPKGPQRRGRITGGRGVGRNRRHRHTRHTRTERRQVRVRNPLPASTVDNMQLGRHRTISESTSRIRLRPHRRSCGPIRSAAERLAIHRGPRQLSASYRANAELRVA